MVDSNQKTSLLASFRTWLTSHPARFFAGLALIACLLAACAEKEVVQPQSAFKSNTSGSHIGAAPTYTVTADPNNPGKYYVTIYLVTINEKIDHCPEQAYVLNVDITDGQLRNDAVFSSYLPNANSPLLHKLSRSNTDPNRHQITFRYPTAGNHPRLDETLILVIDNRGTNTDESRIVESVGGSCKVGGGDQIAVMIDNYLPMEMK